VKRRSLAIALIAASLGLVAVLFGVQWPHPNNSGTSGALSLATPPKGGDFVLRSANGPVDLKDFRGKAVLIYFGYTSCPDICPTNLAYIGAALKSLAAADLARVQALFVTVDPERDDTDRVARYAAYFHPQIVGLTGSPKEIAAAARAYGAAYRRVASESAMGYMVDHSASTYVVDPRGRLDRTLDHATPPERIAATLRELLSSDTGRKEDAK
jgi:protein SCO1